MSASAGAAYAAAPSHRPRLVVERIENREINVVTICVYGATEATTTTLKTDPFIIRVGFFRSKWIVRATLDEEDFGLHIDSISPDHLEPPAKFNIDLEFRLFDDNPAREGAVPIAVRSTRHRYIRFSESQGWTRFCRRSRLPSAEPCVVKCHLRIHDREAIDDLRRYQCYPIESDDFDFRVCAGKLPFVGSQIDGISDYAEFFVHKSVLSSSSPVLSAMFRHDVIETRDRRLCLPDVSPDVVRKWITFAYSGSCFPVEPHAEDLLLLADRYHDQDLFRFAQEHLAREVKPTTCLKSLALAEEFKAPVLLRESLHCFVEFGEEVMTSTEWMEMLESRPETVGKIVAFLWKSFKSNRRPASFPPCCHLKH